MKNHLTPRAFLLMLLGTIGASIGALIYFWGTPSTPKSQAFVTSPEFVTWFFINEVLFAAYPILVVLFWEPIKQLKKHVCHNILEILGASLMLLVLFIFPPLLGAKIIGLKPLPFEYADNKILIIEIVGFFASALPLAVGIWLIQAAIRDAFSKPTPAERDINDYISFRDYLQQFLTSLGTLLSLFILAGAALRAAALASGATTASDYPPIYLLVLGAYYTLLIAIIYFPTYLSLASAGRHLLDVYFPLPTPGSGGWATKYSDRKQLEDLLELRVTGEQRFLASITLLAPFVSSIFSLLVEK